MPLESGSQFPRRTGLRLLRREIRVVLAASVVAIFGTETASAHYIGPAYVKLPGLSGGAKDAAHKGWVRTESHYWGKHPRTWFFGSSILTFSGPMAPASGSSQLNVAVDKHSPGYRPLMAQCAKGGTIPEIMFAEDSHLSRNPLEGGPVPSDVPAQFEYVLKNVQVACPIAADASEQAFIFSFDDIQWSNYKPYSAPRSLAEIAQPANLGPTPLTGKTKIAVLTWLAGAVDASPEQCPKMNTKPPQEAYFRYLPAQRAAEQRSALASKGGADANLMSYRGPGELNVTMLPGIVADPGHAEPQAGVVPGLNLDSDDGKGSPPKGIRKHRNFTAPWGESGVDNQMFLVEGCVAGWRRNGFLPLISNDMRASGELSILIRVSGIDDEKNDNDVTVDLLYSRDGMKRVGSAKVILSDYTYRVSDKIEDTHDFVRFHGNIVNGVITTEPVEKMELHYSNSSGMSVYRPRLRLEFKPDGSLNGILGGYRDWREYIGYAFLQKGQYEATIGYDSAGMYNAIRRAADGLQDPNTGEYLGISTAWDLEGISAFIPPEQQQVLANAH